MSALAVPLPDEPPVLGAGDEVAPGYTVVGHLARGRAVDVYEVWSEERLCRCVAKTIRPDRVDVARVRYRLLQEGWLLKVLAHLHLPRAIETVEGASPVVILETDVGPTLAEVIGEGTGRQPVADLGHLGRQLTSAVGYLHGQGYLHLDIRPGNVLVHGDRATLVDLSIARPPGRVHRGLGTPEYLAPEQARGGIVTAATDVWGLGATLFEAATGVAPFAPLDEAERLALDAGTFLQLQRPAPPFSRLPAHVPAPFAELVTACLAPDPADRPVVRDLHDRLGEVLAVVSSAAG
ncbi:Protein kinase domain-containing protein [Nocardioides exalbidus]|uniref:Protein kinase domain-containing protein n=1 Tax=Nocardioides exalbidus TaxID=402596 RepID=A0A1H4W4D3_9ACTN|nr:serine/threonine-protein kinase [Nocardioides exalbidus]SEC88229.1 Protein kinase domain-containing protein [Nocardioides exalbidus]